MSSHKPANQASPRNRLLSVMTRQKGSPNNHPQSPHPAKEAASGFPPIFMDTTTTEAPSSSSLLSPRRARLGLLGMGHSGRGNLTVIPPLTAAAAATTLWEDGYHHYGGGDPQNTSTTATSTPASSPPRPPSIPRRHSMEESSSHDSTTGGGSDRLIEVVQGGTTTTTTTMGRGAADSQHRLHRAGSFLSSSASSSHSQNDLAADQLMTSPALSGTAAHSTPYHHDHHQPQLAPCCWATMLYNTTSATAGLGMTLGSKLLLYPLQSLIPGPNGAGLAHQVLLPPSRFYDACQVRVQPALPILLGSSATSTLSSSSSLMRLRMPTDLSWGQVSAQQWLIKFVQACCQQKATVHAMPSTATSSRTLVSSPTSLLATVDPPTMPAAETSTLVLRQVLLTSADLCAPAAEGKGGLHHDALIFVTKSLPAATSIKVDPYDNHNDDDEEEEEVAYVSFHGRATLRLVQVPEPDATHLSRWLLSSWPGGGLITRTGATTTTTTKSKAPLTTADLAAAASAKSATLVEGGATEVVLQGSPWRSDEGSITLAQMTTLAVSGTTASGGDRSGGGKNVSPTKTKSRLGLRASQLDEEEERERQLQLQHQLQQQKNDWGTVRLVGELLMYMYYHRGWTRCLAMQEAAASPVDSLLFFRSKSPRSSTDVLPGLVSSSSSMCCWTLFDDSTIRVVFLNEGAAPVQSPAQDLKQEEHREQSVSDSDTWQGLVKAAGQAWQPLGSVATSVAVEPPNSSMGRQEIKVHHIHLNGGAQPWRSYSEQEMLTSRAVLCRMMERMLSGFSDTDSQETNPWLLYCAVDACHSQAGQGKYGASFYFVRPRPSPIPVKEVDFFSEGKEDAPQSSFVGAMALDGSNKVHLVRFPPPLLDRILSLCKKDSSLLKWRPQGKRHTPISLSVRFHTQEKCWNAPPTTNDQLQPAHLITTILQEILRYECEGRKTQLLCNAHISAKLVEDDFYEKDRDSFFFHFPGSKASSNNA